MNKANQARDRIASNPGILAAIGAAAGGTLGMALGKKAKSSRYEERFEKREPWYEERWETREFQPGEDYASRTFTTESAEPGYVPSTGWGRPDYSASPEAGSWSEPYRSPASEQAWQSAEGHEPSKGEQLKHKAQDFKHRMSEKTGEMKHRMSEKRGEMKHRVSEKSGEMKHRVARKREQMQQRSHEQGSFKERMPSAGDIHRKAQGRPLGTILGGAALGMLAASLLPLTRKERKVMHPAKEQLGEQFRNLEHKVEDRLGGGEQGEARGVEGAEWQGQSEAGFTGAAGTAHSNAPGGPLTGGQTGGTAGTESRYATSAGEPGSYATPPAEAGTRRTNPDEPYRQPSFAEQLEDEKKIH